MLFYVCMQKRKDGKLYPDLHKTDGRFYLTKEEAEKALQEDEYREFKHVVELEANLVY